MADEMSSARFPLTLIVAATTKNGIGKNNGLPWPMLKKEMAYFARVTKRVPEQMHDETNQAQSRQRQNVVIMGRKTWDSIPPKFRPLKDRTNVVISSQDRAKLGNVPDEVIVASDILSGLHLLEEKVANDNAPPVGRAFVIGGTSIYQAAMKLPETQSILLTRIMKDYDCDAFFPDIEVSGSGWQRKSQNELSDYVGEQVPEDPIVEDGTTFQAQLFQRR